MSVIILDKPVKKVFVGLQQKATNDQEIREYLEEIGVTYLTQDTYPFTPNLLQFDNAVYVLNEKLLCNVDYEDDMYIVENELLNIHVWGETREDAEIAFAFNFHSLYLNFALEKDDKLSPDAILLKNKLLKIVKKTML